jgi:hypothetical protein
MKPIKKQGYITEKEAAKLLGKHERWFQKDRHSANKGNKLKIPFIKQGKGVLYKKEDVLKFKEVLGSPISAELTPSKPFSKQSGFQDKIYALTKQTDAKIEDLARRVRALEEKQNKGWFARWRS